jgi:hypothetical protein
MTDAQIIGDMIGDMIMEAVRVSQVNSPRSQQTALGMSQLGGCREYIRSTIEQEDRGTEQDIKWAAFVGTAVGDMIEKITKVQHDAVTQEYITCEIEVEGLGTVKATGSADMMLKPTAVIDLKTKAELDTVRRDGPSFKEKAQIAGYLIGAIQGKQLGPEATGHLVYIDRSGREKTAYVWSLDVPMAEAILMAVGDRLQDVANAIETGQRAPRDEHQSWCRAVQCPFYAACWAGYEPTGAIEHPEEIKAVEEFIEARAQVKAWTNTRDTRREALRGVEGVTASGAVVQWKIVQSKYGESDRLEVTE